MPPILLDQPSGAALLDAARQALLDEFAPALTGRQRYVVLMVANAIGVAKREIEGAQASALAWQRVLGSGTGADGDPLAALVAAIRAGQRDADAALHAALCEATEVAAGIWKPAAGA